MGRNAIPAGAAATHVPRLPHACELQHAVLDAGRHQPGRPHRQDAAKDHQSQRWPGEGQEPGRPLRADPRDERCRLRRWRQRRSPCRRGPARRRQFHRQRRSGQSRGIRQAHPRRNAGLQLHHRPACPGYRYTGQQSFSHGARTAERLRSRIAPRGRGPDPVGRQLQDRGAAGSARRRDGHRRPRQERLARLRRQRHPAPLREPGKRHGTA